MCWYESGMLVPLPALHCVAALRGAQPPASADRCHASRSVIPGPCGSAECSRLLNKGGGGGGYSPKSMDGGGAQAPLAPKDQGD